MVRITLLVVSSLWPACFEKHRGGGLACGSKHWLLKSGCHKYQPGDMHRAVMTAPVTGLDNTAYEQRLPVLIGCRENFGPEGFQAFMRHELGQKGSRTQPTFHP